ncbi:MAG: ABC transporter permease, partial [Vicinamibacteria bacterium]
MLRDLKLALRMLLHRPGLLAGAILSLALGIGVNVSVFSVVNGALLKPLPYRDSDRLAMIWHTFGKGQSLPAIHPMDYRDYKDRSRLFEDFALVGGGEALMQTKSDSELIRSGNVSANFFSFLGVEPILGRQFNASEDVPGAPGVVMLNYDLWQRQFGGDPSVVGRAITLDGRPFEVIGVLPRDFELYVPAESFFIKRPQIWRPARIDYATLPPRNWTAWGGIGRMKAGVTLEQAQQEMSTIGAALRRENAVFEAGDLHVTIVPLERDLVKSVRGGLWALMGAVSFVLLIACANVARLLLARGFSREDEFRMRAALGASGMQLARSVMAEGIVISIGGALAGIQIAQLSLQLIRTAEAAAIPRLETVSLDWTVLGFAVAAGLFATLLSAVIPGLRAAQAMAFPGAANDSRTLTGSAQRKALQDRLVIAQVTLAVIVVVGTGFMIRSFRAMVDVDLGFEPKGVITMRVGLPRAQFPDDASARAFFVVLDEKLKGLPGVISMAGSSL